MKLERKKILLEVFVTQEKKVKMKIVVLKLKIFMMYLVFKSDKLEIMLEVY